MCNESSSIQEGGVEFLLTFLYSLYKLGMQGHIEDVAVAADQQGKKFGVLLIQALGHIAEQIGCYKACIPALVTIRSKALIQG